jgi:hypothetical protein
LIDCFGAALKIRVAFQDAQPISAILTLRHKDALVYKYGGSDAQFHPLGGMQNCFSGGRFWMPSSLDCACSTLSRSEWGHAGLIAFKDHWGAVRSELRYSRISFSQSFTGVARPAASGWKERLAKRISPHLSDRLFRSADGIICKHLA